MLFFKDSWGESLAEVRENAGLSRSIVLFSTAFHVAVSLILIAAYWPDDLGHYQKLLAWTATGFVGFTGWILMGVGTMRPAGGPVRRSPGLANYLTLCRFFLIVPATVLLVHGYMLVGGAIYVVLGLTDVLDGIVARVRREQTEFGVVMDPLADVFSTAAVFAVLTFKGPVPTWVFAILMVRYGMLILGSFLLFLVVGPVPFRATLPGKIVGIVQGFGALLVIGCLLWDRPLLERIGPALYVVLGLVFASIIVSQLILGLRHVRNGSRPRSKAVHVGS